MYFLNFHLNQCHGGYYGYLNEVFNQFSFRSHRFTYINSLPIKLIKKFHLIENQHFNLSMLVFFCLLIPK